ncbi:WD40 repeat-like protein [Xylariaceae sp. AK1471]|nr:WD40 repeat-like protein [Xylariaceae sp. AK1471]
MFSRKQRRADLDLPSGELSSSHGSTASSRTLFSLSKTFSKTSISSGGDIVDDPKGPLGLTLLSSPSEPRIDFIFVHGLGGGSRKTWSKTPLQSHYWPQEWLGKDSAFKNVRIHSYGYDSDYLKGKENCLNIHHIGKSFLSAICTSPSLVDSQTTIVAIGHSMGGLVIKKAYVLAKQDAAYKNLAGRFAAVYFLATPHRGADSAKTLKNLLKVAYDRTYVADLERNSGAIQVINDEFRHFSTGLELWSFYETQNMKLFSSPIVDPESAILGYREEKQVPMNADHRSICKFETPFEANYTILRNALASTVSNIAVAIPELKLKEKRDRIKDLSKYLEVSGILDDDFHSVRDVRMQESCQWLLTKVSYSNWRDGELGNNRTLWIKGKPATGKSVLAGYIIDHLQDSGQSCSYFFFKHGDRSKSRLGRCLRSLAFQMASSNIEASDALLEMQADGIRLDHVDDRTLWRLLFLSGIFPATMSRHYWVIDALDECSDPTVLFDSILSNANESVPLKILITSRDTVDLDQGFSGIPSDLVRSLSISPADTLSDLRLLADRMTKGLGIVEAKDRVSLTQKILDKSRGSFLWTILVLKELLRCHSKKEIDQILEDVPRGMESLYKRTLDSMSAATRGKKLTKAILMWVACAVRPMTTSELNDALSLDIDDTFPKLEETIAALCGQLVLVDKFGRVQMVHETAREFLLGEGLDSEFSINKSRAHRRMAQICLVYLVGEEMKPPRTNRRRFSANIPTKKLDFAVYACIAYSYHLSKADPAGAEPFQLLEQFLRSNVLTWIEAIADSRNLNQLIRASKHLKIYLNACAVERSPLDPNMQRIRQWITDLTRISAKFASALTISPSAIYSLIPPFCPTDSMIYTSSGPARRLAVIGALSKQWDDRLLCIDFRQGQPSALCYGEEFLAVGLTSRTVALYDATSYQEYKVLDHGESVKFIAFKPKANIMATCGMKMVKIWDIRSGEAVRSLESPPRPLDMEFDGDTLLVASHKNYIASWDTGQNAKPEPSQRPWNDKPETSHTGPRQSPCALSLSVSHGMLAVAYSGQPITLWDLEEDAYFGSCGKKLSSGETSTHVVVSLAFNPNPNIGLLAVAYLDGDLALLDPFADQQLECFRANCQTLAPSPNGRLLAAGGANGIIHVYEFDTFKLLYRVKSSNSYIKQLGFARDSLRLADIRGAQCTVWEPEALLRDSLSDDSSGITSSSTSVVETVTLGAKAKITAMAFHSTADVIFCGKDDGTVELYSCKTAARERTLCCHKSPVRLLVWCERRNALLSVDAANRIFLHGIQKLTDVAVCFQSHLQSEKAIVDVLVGEAMGKYVVSTRESDHIFNLNSGEHEEERTYPHMLGIRKWLQCPRSSQHLICVCGVNARVYCWADWSEVGSFSFSLDTDTVQLKNAILYSFGQEQRIMLELLDRNSSISSRRIAIFDANCFVPENQDEHSLLEKQSNAVAMSNLSATDYDRKNITISSRLVFPLGSQLMSFASSVAHVIGINEFGRFVFLDRSSWVCSTDLSKDVPKVGQGEGPSTIEIFRHFFVPYDWFAGARDIVCTLAHRDIMLTRGGDLTTIRGAFEYADKVIL